MDRDLLQASIAEERRIPPEAFMDSLKRILVPTDFEASSSRALELAIAIAQSCDAELTLLHVCEIPSYSCATSRLVSAAWVSSLEQSAAHELAEALRQARQQMRRTNSLIRTGVPWREIVATATALDADLVVMGTHGRTGLSNAILGSVAERVMRMSRVPVLTTHDPVPALMPLNRDAGFSAGSA